MSRVRHPQQGRPRRFLWLVIITVAVAGTGYGLYELYTTRTRENTRQLLARAESAAAEKDWTAAAVAYRQYLQRETSDVDALQAYADVLLITLETTPEAVSDAIRTLRRIVALQPDNTDATEKLTELFLRTRQYSLATELATGWVALDPRSAKATLALATSQHLDRNSREAADTLIAGIARKINDPAVYALLVRLLTGELNEPDEAAKWLEKALIVGPSHAGVQMAVAAFYESQSQLDKSEAHLQRALDLEPDSLDTLLPAALFYLAHQRLDEADALLDHATQVAPKNPNIAAIRAMWATRSGRPSDLIAAADDLYRVGGDDNMGVLVQAAELYLTAGAFSRTDECLTKIDTLPPVTQPFEIRLRVLRGTRAFQKGDYYSAIRHLRPVINREPPEVRVWQLWAATYAQLGDLDGAAQAYERLVRLDPGKSDARLRLAELEWERGRPQRSRGILDLLPRASAESPYKADLIRLASDFAVAGSSGRPAHADASSLEALDRLASTAPANAFTTRWLVRCFAISGQPKRAVDVLSDHLGEAESHPQLGVELGRLLLSHGQNKQALRLSDELIKRFPDAPQGHVLMVRVIAATEGLSQAMAYLDRHELPKTTRGPLLEAVADAYVDADQLETAMGLYRRAADLMTRNVSVRRKLIRRTTDLDEVVSRSEEIRAVEGDDGVLWKFEEAKALLRLDSAAESLTRARNLLKQCLAVRSRWPSARLLLGYAYELTGEHHDAVEAYRTALARNPGLRGDPAAARLVRLQYQLGRVTEADALLGSLIGEYPDNPAILRLRTQQQIRQQEIESALTTAKRVLELQPDDAAWAVLTADLYLRAADPVQAETITRTYLKRTPGSTSLLGILARALIDQHRDKEAVAQVREAADAAGDAPHYIVLARVLAQLDRTAEAEQAITQAQTLAADDATIWEDCANAWGLIHQRPQQVACLRNAVTLRGEDPSRSLALARLLATGGTAEEREEAARMVRQRITSDPQDAEALVLRGQMMMLATPPDPTAAEADFLKAVSIDPRRSDAYRLLGLVQMRFGRFDAVRQSINRGLAISPKDPALLLASAELYSVVGDHERAIGQLQLVLDTQPRMPAALRLLANAYRGTHQIDEGIAFIEAHTTGDERSAEEIVILAKLHESKKDLERAARLFAQAVAADPSSSQPHQEQLQFFARRNDFDKVHDLAGARQREYPVDVRSFAVAAEMLGSQKANDELRQVGMGWLATIAREHPDHAAAATYRAALCFYGQGLLREAERMFLESRRLDPTNRDLINNLAWLYAADLRKPAEAVELIKQFLENGGKEDDHLLDTHCVALIRMGQLDAAEQKARECLRRTGRTPTRTAATYHLGIVLVMRGRGIEARPYLRQAMQLDEQLGGLTAEEKVELRRMLAAPNTDTGTVPSGQ